jgi:hypothetical protein
MEGQGFGGERSHICSHAKDLQGRFPAAVGSHGGCGTWAMGGDAWAGAGDAWTQEGEPPGGVAIVVVGHGGRLHGATPVASWGVGRGTKSFRSWRIRKVWIESCCVKRRTDNLVHPSLKIFHKE